VTEISFGQTIDAPLTVTEKLTLSGEVSSHNGRGDGSITCLIKRVTSDSSSHELHASIGKKFYLSSKNMANFLDLWAWELV
jgi:DnaJ family protein C protein 11